MSGDTLTVARSRWCRLTKRIHADGKIDAYGRARILDLITVPVADLDAMHGLLVRLGSRPDCAILQIPTQGGHVFRLDVGHRSDLKPATIPI